MPFVLKTLAVIRTVFLAVVIGYTLATSFSVMGGDVRTVSIEGYQRARNAAWMAIGWIAFDTAVGWVLALASGKARARSQARATPAEKPPTAAPRA